jgi:hypothetical protein
MPFHHETIPGNIRLAISGQYAYRIGMTSRRL